jgi:ribosome recycling factor
MQYNFSNFKIEVKKIEDFLMKSYRELNIGRASPSILDGVMVDSYGSMMPLKNLASITIEDPRTLRLVPFDKSQIKNVEKVINAANLGISLSPDDSGIRVVFPQLTTESRQSLVKVLKEKLEDSRIVVRKEREKVMEDIEKMEKESKMTKDEKFRAKEELQKIIDTVNASLESVFKKKEAEVLG